MRHGLSTGPSNAAHAASAVEGGATDLTVLEPPDVSSALACRLRNRQTLDTASSEMNRPAQTVAIISSLLINR
jgi:hypothetical protein